MKFLLLIYEAENRFTDLTPDLLNTELEQYYAFGKEFAAAIQGGDALQPTNTAKCVRVRDGQSSVTDGPFAETKEQLGGYYLVEAADAEEAARIAAKFREPGTVASKSALS